MSALSNPKVEWDIRGYNAVKRLATTSSLVAKGAEALAARQRAAGKKAEVIIGETNYRGWHHPKANVRRLSKRREKGGGR